MMDGQDENDVDFNEEEHRSLNQRAQDDYEESKENMHNRSFKEEQYLQQQQQAAQQEMINANKAKIPRNAEELVVPAHNLKKPIDFNLVGDDDYNNEASAEQQNQ